MEPNRIEIVWSPPLDVAVWGYGPRIDRGGYIYRIFRGNRTIMSGSFSGLRPPADVITYATKLAMQKDLYDIPVHVISEAPLG